MRLYYLTDNTIQEKSSFSSFWIGTVKTSKVAELFSILERIYPDLRAYLTPYRFKNELLDSYFQEVQISKRLSTRFPNFMEVVEKQAVDRDYNIILPPRVL